MTNEYDMLQADFLQGFFIWFNQKVYHLPSVYLQVYIADRAQADFFRWVSSTPFGIPFRLPVQF